MSPREKKKVEKKRQQRGLGPITRRQQLAVIRQLKGQEIAASVAKNIWEAVTETVDIQLKAIRDTMLDLIDRVVDIEARLPEVDTLQTTNKFHCVQCGYVGDSAEHETCGYLAIPLPTVRVRHEGDCDNRQERAEGSAVQQINEVVSDEGLGRKGSNSEDREEGP